MLRDYRCVLEVGIGRRFDLAEALVSEGIEVYAVDIKPIEAPSTIEIHAGDVRTIDPDRFDGVDAIYARRLPPELHRPTARLAKRLGVPFMFTTLGGDPPTLPVSVHTGSHETVFRVDPGSIQV